MKNAGNKNREPHQDEVRDLGAAARRQGRGDKLDARYKRQRKDKRKGRALGRGARPGSANLNNENTRKKRWQKNREPHQDKVRDLGAAARRQGRGDKLDARYKRQRKGKRKGRTWNAACVQASPG